MVKSYRPAQGDIMWVNLAPTPASDRQGHEQDGRRPVLVISNDVYHTHTHGFAIICPITTKPKEEFPLYVKLDNRTKTQGTILCTQVRSIDCVPRRPEYIETLPPDLLETVIDIVYGQIEEENRA